MTELEKLKSDFSERLSIAGEEATSRDAERMVGLISEDDPPNTYRGNANLVLFYIIASLAVEVEKLESRIEELENGK